MAASCRNRRRGEHDVLLAEIRNTFSHGLGRVLLFGKPNDVNATPFPFKMRSIRLPSSPQSPQIRVGDRDAERNRAHPGDPGSDCNEAGGRVNGFPSLKNDLRIKGRLKKKSSEQLTDDAVEANSQAIAKKWGGGGKVSAGAEG